jgi:hypothetical protein
VCGRPRPRDPAAPDPELERVSAPGDLGEEVDDRLQNRRIEQPRGVVVVSRGDALIEVAVVVQGWNLLHVAAT